MSSRVGGIGSTLTGGIQDIAAILPLPGTEQWTYYTFGSVRATSKIVVIDSFQRRYERCWRSYVKVEDGARRCVDHDESDGNIKATFTGVANSGADK